MSVSTVSASGASSDDGKGSQLAAPRRISAGTQLTTPCWISGSTIDLPTISRSQVLLGWDFSLPEKFAPGGAPRNAAGMTVLNLARVIF
ncbi:MAG: hypothetical protein CVT77_17155 [Alphaproteobacteria bacterium HGW-Alphaproteobacteria-16]|nr:MAG: hypothetical protein CVT77_17155 [Alphaproteobacteria bacterium HGW-Alphaproteobacteria-16]